MDDRTVQCGSARGAAARAMGAMCLSAFALAAQALPVTSLENATALPIPAVNFVGLDTVAPGVTYVSTFAESVFGFTGNYGFGTNGQWIGTPMIGLKNPNGSFELHFSDPVSGFLADINWTVGAHNGNASMTAYDAAGIALESLALEKKVGGGSANTVAPGLHGFQRQSQDIAFIRFSNESIGIRNLSVTGLDATGSSIPEPGTLALASLAILGVAASLRRRKAGKR